MTIAVEAGLGFEGARAKAATNGKGALAEELIRTLQDMSIGQARKDAYQALGDRTSYTDLRRFTRSVPRPAASSGRAQLPGSLVSGLGERMLPLWRLDGHRWVGGLARSSPARWPVAVVSQTNALTASEGSRYPTPAGPVSLAAWRARAGASSVRQYLTDGSPALVGGAD
jgi:hypothetical protein